MLINQVGLKLETFQKLIASDARFSVLDQSEETSKHIYEKGFNDAELAFIAEALLNVADKWKAEIQESESEGKRNVFGENYPHMYVEELTRKLIQFGKHEQYRFKLSDEELLEIFCDALCGGSFCFGSFKIRYDKDEYSQAREKLTNPSWESVVTQILRDGNEVIAYDLEGDDHIKFTLADLHKNFRTLVIDYPNNLARLRNESYDAIDTDNILQILIFGDVTYC